MKRPIERTLNKRIHKKGEGNQSEWRNIPQSETTYNTKIGEMKRHD